MRHRLHRLRATALLAATTLLATLGVTVTAAAPASAGPIGSCADLKSFTLTFSTGGDDLRYNSEVVPYLITTNGDVELQHIWGTLPNDSITHHAVTFLYPHWAVNSCQVTGLRLRHISHPEWYETGDNWNMNSVTLYGYSATGTYKYYYQASPYKRFTGSSPWWPAAP